MIAATTRAATASPSCHPHLTASSPAMTATDPARSAPKCQALDCRAGLSKREAPLLETTVRLTSSAIATPRIANWNQRMSGVDPPRIRCRSPSSVTATAPASRIAASPRAPRFSARRCP